MTNHNHVSEQLELLTPDATEVIPAVLRIDVTPPPDWTPEEGNPKGSYDKTTWAKVSQDSAAHLVTRRGVASARKFLEEAKKTRQKS